MKPEPRWAPGQKAGYHQASSWFILGEVIQRVSGLPFSTYVRREIFEPLGMADSWIGMPPERYLEYWDAGRIGAMWVTEENREGEELKDHGWDSAERVTRGSSPRSMSLAPSSTITAAVPSGTDQSSRASPPEAVSPDTPALAISTA